MKTSRTTIRLWRALSIVSALSFGSITQAYPGYGKAPPATSFTKPVRTLSPENTSFEIIVPKIKIQTLQYKSPSTNTSTKPRPNDFWWPQLLDVTPIKGAVVQNPLGQNFDYAKEFKKLDLKAVKKDLAQLMTTSQSWWPADYGNYGPFFIRMAWHSAGTYRAADGRGGADGGQQRFEPLNSWPDNANLDKARRLLQPLVDKYYPQLSWADAMVLAGDEAMRTMGFKTLGFAGGRVDDWTPDLVYWGPEDKFLESQRFDKNNNLILPLAASVMGLIYVNPEGADGKPDPLLSADHIRKTFGRMGMNDEETVALIAGGHSFGKTHGARPPENCVTGPAPAGASVEEQQLGWKNTCGKGNAEDTITSGIEGAWTSKPVQWTHEFLRNLYKYDWKLQKGPGGKFQWFADNLEPDDHAPNAHGPGKVPVMMLTTDLSLKFDPIYQKISTRFLNDSSAFETAFARAWFKLTHRDLGPKTRYVGSDFPREDFIWQDPLPKANYKLIKGSDAANLMKEISKLNFSTADLVKMAWASAATFRGTDMRGGANGARLRLQPQISWEVNEAAQTQKIILALEGIQSKFNLAHAKENKAVSLADLIVLAGNVGVDAAAKKGGFNVKTTFTPGRTDATQAQTDITSFEFLKVTNDGFRNYYNPNENYLGPAEAFIDRASMLTLNIPEMAVLTGGLRMIGANYQNSKYGVFTKNVGTLSNDFFVNLLDTSTTWSQINPDEGIFVGKDKVTGAEKWTATTHDLIFGSSSELRVVSFAYGTKNANALFVRDFIKAWDKVMNLDRFDVKKN